MSDASIADNKITHTHTHSITCHYRPARTDPKETDY